MLELGELGLEPCAVDGGTPRAADLRMRRLGVHAMSRLAHRLAVARGEEAADLVVRGGRVLSVFTREWLDADVAVVDGAIAGVGRYRGR